MIFPGGKKRIIAYWTDEDGAAFDPDSQEWKIYDSAGTLKDTKDQDDMTNPVKGTWYLDYSVPSNGLTGRWFVYMAAVVGIGEFPATYAFEVWSMFWPTVQEVRDYLAGMEDDRVSPATVQLQIVLAVTEVDNEKSASATQANVTRAYLAMAGYQTYLAYASEFERTMGMVPGPILNHLAYLKAKAEQFLGYVKRGAGQAAIGPIKSFTPTVVPETYEPDAEGEPV